MIPEQKDIVDVITHHWNGFAPEIEPVPKTVRLFRIHRDREPFMARINFDRSQLKAPEMVEFVNYLEKSGCPVPQIVPTKKGTLSAPLKDMALSIESTLPGVDCGSNRLDVLSTVGKGLARIHNASASFAKSPAQLLPLSGYVEQKLTRALKSNVSESEHNALQNLQKLLIETHHNRLIIPVPWLITHGDVRGPNVLVHGNTVGFTDIYSTFAPVLADIVMIKDKWLLGDPDGNGRPLTFSEVSEIIDGYTSVRPLSPEERETFGIVWVAWAAEKLAHFSSHKKIGASRRHLWDFSGQILHLSGLLEKADLLL